MKVVDDAVIAWRWNEHHDPAARLEKVPPLCGQPALCSLPCGAPAIMSEAPHTHPALGLWQDRLLPPRSDQSVYHRDIEVKHRGRGVWRQIFAVNYLPPPKFNKAINNNHDSAIQSMWAEKGGGRVMHRFSIWRQDLADTQYASDSSDQISSS